MLEPMRIRSLFRTYEVQEVPDFGDEVRTLGWDAFVVADTRVVTLHAPKFAGIAPERLLRFAADEHTKTVSRSVALAEELVDRTFRRSHILVAVGGGITQDVVAFTASMLYRGVDWVYVPTTLLAQADSCIGSKTSLNLGDKKNLLGNFYPPSRVFVDPSLLNTLSESDIRSGIGEMLHFFAYSGSESFGTLLRESGRLVKERAALAPFIRESLAIKAAVVECDEFDRGERHKFNYGHTFGHALESVTDYAIPHGQAVTVGMDVANFIAVRRGLMARQDFDALHGLLRLNFPCFEWNTIDVDAYIRFLRKDKKNVDDRITCILASRLGALSVERVPADAALADAVRTYFGGVVAT